MQLFKHMRLFFHIHWQHLKRKWLILPLLLLLPLFIIGMILFLVASFFQVDDGLIINIGVVDQDQSEETTMIVNLLEESSELGTLHIESLSEFEANEKIANNELSSYIVLPDNFAEHLYAGQSVNLAVYGNREQALESQMIYELINSLMRHIQTAQANILLINEYASRTTIDDSARSELVINEFMRSLMNVLGRDQMVDEQWVENQAWQSPQQYFILSTYFIVVTLWLLILNGYFYREEDDRLKKRLRVYGVTLFEQVISRMLVVLFIGTILYAMSLSIVYKLGSFEFYFDDLQRISLILLLYSIGFLFVLAIIEILFTDQRFRLLIHAGVAFLLIAFSGAILPVIYFPLYIQDLLNYLPSYQALFWLQEILLQDRLYANYWPLLIFMIVSMVLFLFAFVIKERGYE